MGHYFGLPHTFTGSNNEDPLTRELVTRGSDANCETAGDGFCDTPADPYVYGTSTSYFGGCEYTDVSFDVNGDQYTPMINNIMSYYSGCSEEYFTQNQFSYMQSFLSDPSRSGWDNECEEVVAPNNLTATLDPEKGLLVSWNDNADNETGYKVESNIYGAFEVLKTVEANVQSTYYGQLLPNSTFQIRVRPSNSPLALSEEITVNIGDVYCFPYRLVGCDEALSEGIGLEKIQIGGEVPFEANISCNELGYNLLQESTSFYQGFSYEFDLTAITLDNNLYRTYHAWIDKNNDFIFSEDEKLTNVSYFYNGTGQIVLDVDETFALGQTRMRIKTYNTFFSWDGFEPCNDETSGATLDLNILIEEKPSVFDMIFTDVDQRSHFVTINWQMSQGEVSSQALLYTYNIDNESFEMEDTVDLSLGTHTYFVPENGTQQFFFREAETGKLLSDIYSLNVDGIEYCTPSYSQECNGYYISNVIVKAENYFENPTSCEPFTYGNYEDSLIDIYPGVAYEIIVHQGEGNYFRNNIYGWIDLNEDNVFDSESEQVFFETFTNSSPYYVYNRGLILLPDSIVPGTKTFRLVHSPFSVTDPCDYGIWYVETEDYSINLMDVNEETFPLSMSLQKNGDYELIINWTNISSIDKDVLVYRTFNGSSLELIGEYAVGSLTAEDLIIPNGNYTYFLKDREGRLLSMPGSVIQEGVELPYNLQANRMTSGVVVEWNYNDFFLDSAYLQNTNYLDLGLWTSGRKVRLSNLNHIDYNIYRSDTIISYRLVSESGRVISDTFTLEAPATYCYPIFNNEECLDNLSFTYSSTIWGVYTYNILYNSVCSFNKNSFREIGQVSIPDTLFEDTDSRTYHANVNTDMSCVTNEDLTEYQRNVKVWMDYNEDGTFSDDEIIYQNETNTWVCFHSFKIPFRENVTSGLKKIRFIVTEDNEAIDDPCGTYNKGAGYDYSLYYKGDEQLVGLNELTNYEITVYPNPSEDGYFNIISENKVGNIEVFDQLGSLIYSGEPNNLKKLTPGFYILRIHIEEIAFPVVKSVMVK